MDLTIDVDKFRLNIRVAALLCTQKGFLFEKGKDGYYFVLGGRVKINESSLEAAKREIFEEISVSVNDIKLVSVVENFFVKGETSFHEICFVYSSSDIINPELPKNIVELTTEVLQTVDVRPPIIKKIIAENKNEVSHFIIKA